MISLLQLPVGPVRYLPGRYIAWLLLLSGLLSLATAQAQVVVSSKADSGPGSLRQAIASADAGSTLTITATGTLILTSGELVIDKDITITGPGAGQLTISGNNTSRIFFINPGAPGALTGPPSSNPTVKISGLTIANGRAAGGSGKDGGGGGGGAAGLGGGVFINRATVTLDQVAFLANQAIGGNGGAGGKTGGAGGGGGGIAGPGNNSRDETGGSGGSLGGNGTGPDESGGEGAGGGGGGTAGNGGFGGGGGGGTCCQTGDASPGTGGFGAGSGGAGGKTKQTFSARAGGLFGGAGGADVNDIDGGGGSGGGLGGALFIRAGSLTVQNSTFTGNQAAPGVGGAGKGNLAEQRGGNGQGKGGAVFILNAAVSAPGATASMTNTTFSDNTATDAGSTTDDNANTYGAFIDNCLAPAITRQPTSNSSVCAGATVTTSVSTSGVVTGYQWYRNGNVVSGQTSATLTLPNTTVAISGSYQAVVTGNCTSVTSTAFSLTVNAPPTVSITPSATTGCAGTIITLSAQGADTYVWNTGATTTAISVSATGTGVYSVTGTLVSTGCSATASQSITIYPLPATPSLLTQQGQRYPGGQSSVTVDLNSGNVNLVVSGCNGTITWTGPNGTAGSSSPIVVATSQPGRFIYMATCTSAQGCTSPASSATVTVQGRLTVLHRDVDNYATNNAIQPLLQLQNQGSTALPLSAITLRYYVTVEGGGALSNLSVNYAQVGNQNVRLRYVPLQPAQPGAAGYVEVGFTAGAGSLAAGANSGAIQAYFAKGDYSGLNETDDYSYNPVRDQLTSTLRITAYYNGALIAGIEPGSTATVRAVRALTESRNGPSATQINTVLEVRNEGTVPINYSDLSARYYFTSDGNERLQVEVDEGSVSAQLVALSQPVAGANYYLAVRYNQTGQLAPGASTGAIRYRISKPDGGRFDQTNDYSYQEQPAERSQNSRVVVLVGSDVVWGTPPSGSARLASGVEPGSELRVQLLGNPVEGDQLRVEIRGVQGQPLHLSVSDLTGRVVSQRRIEAAGAIEQQTINVSGSAAGLLLLQVSIPGQTQTLKVLKGR